MIVPNGDMDEVTSHIYKDTSHLARGRLDCVCLLNTQHRSLCDFTLNASHAVGLPPESVSVGTVKGDQGSQQVGALPGKLGLWQDALGDHCLPAGITDACNGSELCILLRRRHLGTD